MSKQARDAIKDLAKSDVLTALARYNAYIEKLERIAEAAKGLGLFRNRSLNDNWCTMEDGSAEKLLAALAALESDE